MKKALYLLFAFGLLVSSISPGYASTGEGDPTNEAQLAFSHEGYDALAFTHQAADLQAEREALVEDGENLLAFTSPAEWTIQGYDTEATTDAESSLLAFHQEDSGGGSASAEEEAAGEFEEAVDDAIEHWYDRPVGQEWTAWLGWGVAAIAIFLRVYASLRKKTDNGPV